MSKYTLSVTNKKLYDFYTNNQNINFEDVNIVFYEILVKLTDNMAQTLSSSINGEILSNIQKQDGVINELKCNLNIAIENINKIKQETAIFSELKNDILNINNNVSLKFVDFKNDYISGVKSLLIENNDRNSIIDSIQKSNEIFIDKTKLLLNENISSLMENNHNSMINNTKLLLIENNDKYISQIDNTIKTFQTSISDELNKLTNNNDDNAIKDFISTFDSKCSNMFQTAQQPVYNILQSTEERIQNNIQAIKDNTLSSQSKHENTMDELSTYLRKFNNSSYKGAIGECKLENLLNEMYPSAEIINSSGTKACGDFMLKRENKPSIMMENKVYDMNVKPEEVDKFIRDVSEIKTHAIFLSQNSGITRKRNFQVDIHKGCILVYIHNVQYSREKIQLAIDIIENLAEKMQELDSDEEMENIISKSQLDEINQEYIAFNKQREEIIISSKDFQRKLLSQLDNLKINALNKYLSTRYANTEKSGYTCELCNLFTAPTKKSLSAHVRACKKQHEIKIDTPTLCVEINSNSS